MVKLLIMYLNTTIVKVKPCCMSKFKQMCKHLNTTIVKVKLNITPLFTI